jgi:hypothetical protein
VLLSRPPGYPLDIGAEQVDIGRFEQLVVDARAAAARGASDAAGRYDAVAPVVAWSGAG